MSRHLLIFLLCHLLSSQTFAADSLEQLVHRASSLKLSLFGDELLQPEQAFEFSATVKNANTLYVNWEIAANYYLYREKIKLELKNANGVKLGDYSIPNGLPKHDEVFGQVEIFSEGVDFDVPLLRESSSTQTVTLQASFQGCAERGVCYPPMTKETVLELPISQQLSALSELDVKQSVPFDMSETLKLGLLGCALIIFSVQLNALDLLPENRTHKQKLYKGVGVVMLIYGVLLLIGASLGNSDFLQPLHARATRVSVINANEGK